jgi:hypothetical protein
MNLHCVSAVLLVAVLGLEAWAATTNDPIAGRELAQELRSLRPETSFTNTGKLFIRASKKQRWEVSYTCRVIITPTNWTSFYSAARGTNTLPGFSVEHRENAPNIYRDAAGNTLNPAQTIAPFAGSDFWLADLGLEFFHWPEQRVLKWEMKRSFGCKVLESRNPDPAAGGYGRVLSWIHEETGGLIQAEAYDSHGKFLKEFRPTETKKVNGRRELKEMVIENVQTDSTTTLVFDL